VCGTTVTCCCSFRAPHPHQRPSLRQTRRSGPRSGAAPLRPPAAAPCPLRPVGVGEPPRRPPRRGVRKPARALPCRPARCSPGDAAGGVDVRAGPRRRGQGMDVELVLRRLQGFAATAAPASHFPSPLPLSHVRLSCAGTGW